ncbi:MAG: ferritin [Geobacteraceae bacterium GWC2_58_44]|nr:MAG: ferritin [Geobacteraceae bacterium GWC2_58_44]HBG04006.1 ferritin [Geobacter sp.]
MNVFDCAIKIEEEAKKYYEGLEAVSHQPEQKHLFSMLAASEEEHRNNLIRMKASMATAMAHLDGLDGTACSFRPLLTQRELLQESENDPDLYRFTVREEENEIRFYEELASIAGDEVTRKSLLMVAEEERRHLATVENIYAFVEAPRSYLAWGEFSNLHEL